MISFDKLEVPREGTKIEIADGRLSIPNDPIIPFIEGDGIGPDIMGAARRVWDASVRLDSLSARVVTELDYG